MLKLFPLLFLLWACGPAWHLQRAELKGAKITADTVWSEWITESTVTDTVTKLQFVHKMFTDTITTETVRWKSTLRIDTLTKTIYQKVECKPDTIRVPFTVTRTISAGHSDLQVVGYVLGAILFCGLMTYGAYKFAGAVQKGQG